MLDGPLVAMIFVGTVFGAVIGGLLFGWTGAVVGAAIVFGIAIGALASPFSW
jgi:hypothetical protein